MILLSTGSRPRVPEWAPLDGVRVLTTRDAYPPPELPEHLVVVGSGVTGVEFVHMFSSFGCQVTLIVSRQQVLPQKDPEVAAALEEDFIRRGVRLLKGARAVGIDVGDGTATVRLRRRSGRHRKPRPAGHRVAAQLRGPRPRRGGGRRGPRLRRGQPQLPVVGAAHLRGRRPVGQAAALVGGRHAGTQDRRARHGPARRSAPPPRLREGGVGHLHRPRDRRRRVWPRPTRSPTGARSA